MLSDSRIKLRGRMDTPTLNEMKNMLVDFQAPGRNHESDNFCMLEHVQR